VSVPKKLEVAGAATLGPIQPTCAPFPSGECVFSINLSQTTQADSAKSLSVNSPVTWVDLLAGTGITNVSFFSLRVRNATNFEVRFTTAGGADQIIRLSDLFVYSSPVSGQQITALSVRGVGDMELLVAGT
jgi:hypothetical protein